MIGPRFPEIRGGGTWHIRRQSGRASFWILISDGHSSILTHFSRSDIGLGMDPEIGNPYPRLWYIERGPLIPDDWSAISGNSWGNRGQYAANLGAPLSRT